MDELDAAHAKMVEEEVRDARARGCNCNPELEITFPAEGEPEIIHVTVMHDEWCVLIAPRNRAERRAQQRLRAQFS